MENVLEKEVSQKAPVPNKVQADCINNTTNGQYMVIAGPGTGKTFTVTRKIKHMIEDEGVDASRILCLTFSNTAAREMKTKIGEEYNVNVYTYHEFCLTVMEDFPDEFDNLNHKIITDAYKRTLISECIEELNPVAYNDEKNNPYQYIQDILDGIEEIKKNRLKDKNEYFSNLDNNPLWITQLKKLLENKEEKKKDNKEISQTANKEIETLTSKIEKMKELWGFNELYTQKMRDLNYIDFYDMINKVLDKFEDENSLLLAEVAEQYDYILVDEYQDTNKAQNDIVFCLAKHCPNIFVVGDDDQIIYTFQGAKLDTIENFLDNFKDVQVKCLTENNRSTQAILDVSKEIAELQNSFCQFKSDKAKTKKEKASWDSQYIDLRICTMPKFKNLKINKDLSCPETSEMYNKSQPVEFYKFDTQDEERDYIVGMIKNIVHSEECPEKLSEIAILTRTNAELYGYEAYLKANGIPVEITGGKNIFKINSVNVLLTYMQFLTNPEKYSDKIMSYLLFYPFHINPKDYATLYEMKGHYKSLRDNMEHLLRKGITEAHLLKRLKGFLEINTKTLIEQLKDLLDDKTQSVFEYDKLKNFTDTYDYLQKYITKESFTNSIIEIGNKTGIFSYYFNDGLNRLENIKGIKKLISEADAYYTININKGSSFAAFVDYLTKMQEGEMEINLDKENKPLNAVQLSTYHSSKGREFEYVFMPALTSYKWESSSSSYKDKIPLPSKGLDIDELTEKQSQAKFLDNIKLLYVGMTRAKRVLVLSSVIDNTRTGKLSWFIEKLQNKLIDNKDLLIYPEKTEMNILETPQYDYNYSEEFSDFIKNHIPDVFSASSLNDYIKCPKAYFYGYILGIQTGGSVEHLTFGNAVHTAFEYATEKASTNHQYPDCNEVYEVFAKYIDENPTEHPDNLKKSGLEHIFCEGGYYDTFKNIKPADKLKSAAEYKLKYTEDGVSFTGSIDRIDTNTDGTYSIYDYKTGKTNDDIKRNGNHFNYYNQIALYKYLYKKQNNLDDDTKISTCFIYPLIKDKCHLELNISNEECKEIVEELKAAAQNIKDMKFDRPQKCPNSQKCAFKDICEKKLI